MGVMVLTTLALGLSPRVRSGLERVRVAARYGGIISACAEQTTTVGSYRGDAGDHLRVCGADWTNEQARFWLWGSPPRVRSRHDG